MKILNIRDKMLGEMPPKVCVSMIGKTMEELYSEINALKKLTPDFVEWRADFFEFQDEKNLVSTLKIIKSEIDMPLIFTLRAKNEGGFNFIENENRLKIINTIIKTRLIEVVDIELNMDKSFINSVIQNARLCSTYTIVSNHHFANTPSKDEMLNIFKQQQQTGADIIKLAVMPNSTDDVLALLCATNEFYKQATTPIISMSMDKLGVITRMGGGVFGSALTFATLKEASAPGQVSEKTIRHAFEALY